MDECKPLVSGLDAVIALELPDMAPATLRALGRAVQVNSIKTRVESAPGFSA